jgi:hypothetical protein
VEKKTASAGTHPAVEKNKDLAHRWHMDMFLKDNWGLADEILTSDFVMHLPGMGDVKGIRMPRTWPRPCAPAART